MLPALLLVALLPLGTMPDVVAWRGGDLVLTLCRVTGQTDIAPPADIHSAPCPFGTLPALAGPPVPLLAVNRSDWVAFSPTPFVAIPGAAVTILSGLGARGPPGGE